eukprot:CAMPEP_0179274928 /NCGR_PEP_ID=MMETSP0797-20121207/33794_1 /TAXON_ID=47934 /ORGANISM="Dinophysis acuminata, Strain DAEP01" /LENGTH=350 /DNA_ID=CAMNT_0020983427 /DNA_START=52 /DNA_END=1101 /DNA_ORIENTATION=-
MAEEEKGLAFFRITLIGASNSGKTALVNAFVNGMCPQRYVRTDQAEVYHKKTEIDDEGEYEDSIKPIFIEIEDTPGSERGQDDDVDTGGLPDDERDRDNALAIRKGIRVVLKSDRKRVMEMFAEFRRGKLQYKPAMDAMLGREYTVKSEGLDGRSFGLPSPDGSEGGVWSFPPDTMDRKVEITLPIDSFLHMGEKIEKEKKNLKERKAHQRSKLRPFSAYERPIGIPELDKTITKNRMGYLVCFDVSDETEESLKEATTVHKMLTTRLAKRKAAKLWPKVMLVGCKCDKTESVDYVKKNIASAKIYKDREEIPFFETSARTFKNVEEVFLEMVQMIHREELLWNLAQVDP